MRRGYWIGSVHGMKYGYGRVKAFRIFIDGKKLLVIICIWDGTSILDIKTFLGYLYEKG